MLVASKVRLIKKTHQFYFLYRKFSHLLIWIKKEEIINKCEKYPIWNPQKPARFESTFQEPLRANSESSDGWTHFRVTGTSVSLVIFNYSNVHTDWTQNPVCKTCVWCKIVFLKTSAHCSKRPPGNFPCSLLLLFCWFDGADLFILILLIGLIAILVRHVRVFNLWGCTRSILHFSVTSL